MRITSSLIRLGALASASIFIVVAVGIRMVGNGSLYSNGKLEQYSGTALYASMAYAGVLFLWPRMSAPMAGGIALAWCWSTELFQLTGIPAALSAQSLAARLVLGVAFDWTDMLWYPVGIVPLVVVDRVLDARSRR